MANFVSHFEKWGRRRCHFRPSWHYYWLLIIPDLTFKSSVQLNNYWRCHKVFTSGLFLDFPFKWKFECSPELCRNRKRKETEIHNWRLIFHSRNLRRDNWIEEFIKRKQSSGLFWAVRAAEKKTLSTTTSFWGGIFNFVKAK